VGLAIGHSSGNGDSGDRSQQKREKRYLTLHMRLLCGCKESRLYVAAESNTTLLHRAGVRSPAHRRARSSVAGIAGVDTECRGFCGDEVIDGALCTDSGMFGIEDRTFDGGEIAVATLVIARMPLSRGAQTRHRNQLADVWALALD